MNEQQLIDSDIEGYLARHEKKELLRFVAVGSVDDGKSTLIGRLLHDTHGIYEDQLAAVKKATRQKVNTAVNTAGQTGGQTTGTTVEGEIDFSLVTDGLKAEREQGITIDVAYRYFSTEKRKFIIADTPGHVQYTRNMATGASTADVAIVLLDARLGVLPQSRRHGYIASLLGIPHLLVAVNKMDLVDYGEARFEELRQVFSLFCGGLDFASVQFFPISATRGDNVVTRSARTPWWTGPTLLEALETVPAGRSRGREEGAPLRFPVQTVIRPHLDYRGFAGQLASGTLHRGDEVVVLPSGTRAVVKAIDVWEGELEEASAPLSVTVRLDREVDASRGDLFARPAELPRIARRFDATMVWLSEKPFDRRRQLLLKHTSRLVPARLESIAWRMDLERLEKVPAAAIELNDISQVTLSTTRPLFLDAYRRSRATGAFILVDALSNDTVAAGMIAEETAHDTGRKTGPVDADERATRLGQRGAALFVGGNPVGVDPFTVERALFERGFAAMVVEAHALSPDALSAVVERCVGAGLVVVVSGVDDVSRDALAQRLPNDRAIIGASHDPATLADAVERVASLGGPA